MSEPQSQEQDRVEALADAYLERLLAGETPDRQQFLAAHPELAELLGPRLELVELMHRIARAQRPAAEKTASLAPPAVPGERVLRVKCPHCGNGIQLVEPASAEVTCSGCGSSFHLEPGATTSFHSAALPRSIGRFEVLEQLGRGAFGTVYKARDTELQRVVAVKVPRAGSFANPQEEERFLREARAAAQLSDPGIVPVLEIAHDRGLPYIVSEYINGLTLADLLTARRPGFRQAAELIAAVADALDCAHRRHIVHRDIKPSNLLIDAAGRPHVTDFGLARRGEAEITVTLDGQILGTPAYMSPEQAAGDQPHVDARSDVYSLGVVLYEMLSGELPFRGNQRMLLHQVLHDEPRPPRSLNDRVPRDLETICLKAMAKAPARRYASAREMADDLRRFLNGEAIRARRVGRAEKLVRWARRNPAVATLTGVVTLLLIAVAVTEFIFVVTEKRLNSDLSVALQKLEEAHRETEVREASAIVDLDLKHCQDGEIEYGVLRLARTLGKLPSHATELRQCVEMNLLAWAQELQPLGPSFQYDRSETLWKISPDGLTVLTGGADGTARLWDAFTGEVRATLRGHRGAIASVAFSENGHVAMTVGSDRTVRLWDASNGQLRGMTAEHPKMIDKALLSPDGGRLLTICHESSQGSNSWPPRYDLKDKATLTLWDMTTGKRISELQGHTGHVNDAVFSPDGQRLLTGGADKTARLWLAGTGRALTILQGHTGAVCNVAFSSDGKIAVFTQGTETCLIHWWDTNRSLQIAPPTSAERDPSQLRFISREVVTVKYVSMGIWYNTYVQGMTKGFRLEDSSHFHAGWATDNVLFDTEGTSYDRNSGRFFPLWPGRKYSADLARFAIDGRFLVGDRLVDLVTEKAIGDHLGSEPSAPYAPDRQTFVSLKAWSCRYVPLCSSPLDIEVAQLFEEVVTCHELDPSGIIRPLKETEWEQRRRKLAAQLEEHSAPSLIGRLAADRWFWLRRQEDRARPSDGGQASEEELKYLDRLVAVEPSWQNYDRRAQRRHTLGRLVEAAQDYLEAGRLAGEGYWHRVDIGNLRLKPDAGNLIDKLILSAKGKPEMYQLGLRLSEKLSAAIPEDRNRRILLAIAHYRLGNYDNALSLLELWQRERDLAIVSQVGQFFLSRWNVLLLERRSVQWDTVQATAFLAMTHHRLGHHDRARHALADLRYWNRFANYQNLLDEAETLIEDRPQPGK